MIDARRALPILLALALLVGCSAEGGAEDDGRRLVRDRLDVIEPLLYSSLDSFQPTDDIRVLDRGEDTFIGGGVRDGVVTYEFGIRRTGSHRYLAGGEATRSVGACFRVTDDGKDKEIAQFSCPQSFLKAAGEPVETEVEVIGRRRPMIEPTRGPGCAALSGGTNGCPGG